MRLVSAVLATAAGTCNRIRHRCGGAYPAASAAPLPSSSSQCFLLFGAAAGVANPFCINVNGVFFAGGGMPEFGGRRRPLVGHYTAFAKNNFFR